MPNHPQDKLSSLILIGFVALLALFTPACVGSARIAQLVNQQVNDEGIARFEIDIHRSIFEREMFRLCHKPPGESKLECVPLAKSVEDGRFILTVDGKRHRVRGIGWGSCILHESSRHCEKIDIAPTRERLSELKRAEQQRIEQEAEAKRLESLRAQEAAEEARREAEAAREQAAREQAAREEEERQRARDREELERAIREDKCQRAFHHTSETSTSFANVYTCRSDGYDLEAGFIVEYNESLLYRSGLSGDIHPEIQGIAHVNASDDIYVDLLFWYVEGDDASYGERIRFSPNGVEFLFSYGGPYYDMGCCEDWVSVLIQEATKNYDVELTLPCAKNCVTGDDDFVYNFDYELKTITCLDRPSIWNESDRKYECDAQAVAADEAERRRNIDIHMESERPDRAWTFVANRTDAELKSKVAYECEQFYLNEIDKVKRSGPSYFDLHNVCSKWTEGYCDPQMIFAAIGEILSQHALDCAADKSSLSLAHRDAFIYDQITQCLNEARDLSRWTECSAGSRVRDIQDSELRQQAEEKLAEYSIIAKILLDISAMTHGSDLEGLQEQISVLSNIRGVDRAKIRARQAQIRRAIVAIEKKRARWWRQIEVGPFKPTMRLSEARGTCRRVQGKWEEGERSSYWSCTYNGQNIFDKISGEVKVAYYDRTQRELEKFIVSWRGAANHGTALDGVYRAVRSQISFSIGKSRDVTEIRDAENEANRSRHTEGVYWRIGAREAVLLRTTSRGVTRDRYPHNVVFSVTGTR